MEIIQHALEKWDNRLPLIPIRIDRRTLAKRRWRGVGEDGQEFGFDLEHPLEDGDVVFTSTSGVYRIAQEPEPVLRVTLDVEYGCAGAAARLGWMVGNLHFPIEVDEAAGFIWVEDDPALRQMFERSRIAFVSVSAVFHPLSAGHSHHAH